MESHGGAHHIGALALSVWSAELELLNLCGCRALLPMHPVRGVIMQACMTAAEVTQQNLRGRAGAKNAQQAAEAAGAMGWRLTADEVAALDAATDRMGAESMGAPFENW